MRDELIKCIIDKLDALVATENPAVPPLLVILNRIIDAYMSEITKNEGTVARRRAK